jgi:16S rRNA (guanine(966)-N(2))-methyltransferase RsmD
MVREALFSMLGDAVPDRCFIDLFAGTGAVGLEALSRGAARVRFIERDSRSAMAIDRHLHDFGVQDRAVVERADAYRWVNHWQGAKEPVNFFLGPPYADLTRRAEDILALIATLQEKVDEDSIIVLQAEQADILKRLPDMANWKTRRYGRNMLLIWVKAAPMP